MSAAVDVPFYNIGNQDVQRKYTDNFRYILGISFILIHVLTESQIGSDREDRKERTACISNSVFGMN